jgi:hypothetical protein
MRVECEIEEFGAGSVRAERIVVPLGPDELPDLIDALARKWSATLRLFGDEQELVVSASSGDFAIVVKLEDGRVFDLVHRADAQGFLGFVDAGNRTDRLRRLCVSRAAAKRTVEEFAARQGADLTGARWQLRAEGRR